MTSIREFPLHVKEPEAPAAHDVRIDDERCGRCQSVQGTVTDPRQKRATQEATLSDQYAIDLYISEGNPNAWD